MGAIITRRRLAYLPLMCALLLAAGLLSPPAAAAAGGDPLAGGNQSALTAFLSADDEFLPVDQAFVLAARLDADGTLHADWFMPAGYYLYRHSLGIRAGDGVALGELQIPAGLVKQDDYFGEVEVYYGSLAVAAALDNAVSLPASLAVAISYQGCADAGLCYPPETRWMRFDTSAAGGSPGVPTAAPGAAQASATNLPAATGASAGRSVVTEESRLAGLLASASAGYAVLIFFLAGIGLAFTPCVLPMVPILSSIIVGQDEPPTRLSAFTLSLAYVLGMAITYATLGVLMGQFGASMNLQAALQSPPVLIGFAAVFAALSLSMFGFYELRLPGFIEQRLTDASQRIGGGKHASVFVMGALSSLIVSPCVSAPLAAALIHISSTGDAVFGGLALLALGLGMGVPLLVIGTGGGHLLPRAGAWMDAVKAVFGVLLLGVAIWLLERVVPPAATLLLWGLLLLTCGVYLGVLDFTPRRGWGQLWKACGAFGFVYGVLLVIGAASGASDPMRPLAVLAAGPGSGAAGQASAANHQGFVAVSDLASVRRAVADAASRGQPVILDLYADWCISCKVMERNVFPEPQVQAQFASFVLLRADVTANTAADQELLNAFGLFGPPSLLVFDGAGAERSDYRIQGEIDAPQLAALLRQFLQENAIAGSAGREPIAAF